MKKFYNYYDRKLWLCAFTFPIIFIPLFDIFFCIIFYLIFGFYNDFINFLLLFFDSFILLSLTGKYLIKHCSNPKIDNCSKCNYWNCPNYTRIKK